MNRNLISAALFLTASLTTFGQAVITGVGPDSNTTSSRIAPGQVITVRVRGLKTQFTSTQVAQSLPLPTNFGGVSITLRQNNDRTGVPLPLIRADFADNCAWTNVVPELIPLPACTDPDAGMYVFQVQLPYKLVANAPGPLGEVRSLVSDAVLSVQENGQAGRDARLIPVLDQVHILRRCDGPAQLYGEDRCRPLLYHNNATAVNEFSPAKSGEYLVGYGYGLGRPENLIDAGVATPANGLRLETPVSVRFTGLPTDEDTAIYSGLVPGQVGLYQFNFRVPELPKDLPACSTDRRSNLTMVVRGSASSDAVGICAQP